MAKVTVSYGLDNEVTTNADTVKEILSSDRIKAFLGFGDSVEAVIDGAVVGGSYLLAEDDHVALRAKAGEKGSL